jgi:hypothetical protein
MVREEQLLDREITMSLLDTYEAVATRFVL